jgi:NAD(P)-dependent dehydrogenase (short-subunit alcohol dehydrogenase family)
VSHDQADGGAVIVTTGDAGVGTALVDALQERGIDAVGVATSAGDARVDLAALFALATPGRSLRAVVHAHAEAASLTELPIGDLTDEQWMERCETPLLHAVHVFQSAFDVFGPLADGAGTRRLVAIVPDIAILGAPRLVPAATLAEGIRSLVRSTGRQWGQHGITVNSVAVPPEILAVGAPSGPVVAVPSLPPVDDPVDDVADAVVALLGPAGGAMNGQTLIVDRGTVMV